MAGDAGLDAWPSFSRCDEGPIASKERASGVINLAEII
jgi:hypothetical protein